MRGIKDESGSVGILFALAIPVLIGFCMLVVDVAQLRYNSAQLQLAADSGALAGVDNIANQSIATSTAASISRQNAPQGASNVTLTSDVTLGSYNSSTGTFSPTLQNPNAVQVKATRSAQRGNGISTYFAPVFGFSSQTVSASAIATTGGAFCHYVLDPSATAAVQFIGAVALNSTCGIQVDSNSPLAISMLGGFNASVSATCIVGNMAAFGLGSYVAAPQTGCPIKPDPLRLLPEPTASMSCQNLALLSLGMNLTPGCYTGSGSIVGSMNLSSGLYQFQNANLTLLAAATLQGSGVTLYIRADGGPAETLMIRAAVITALPETLGQPFGVGKLAPTAETTLRRARDQSRRLHDVAGPMVLRSPAPVVHCSTGMVETGAQRQQ